KERAAAGPFEVESALGACLLLRRRALEEAEGFDEGYFFFLEETDLCFRLRRAGWGIWVLPTARATHLGGGSKAQARAEAWIEYYRSLYRFFRVHRSRSAAAALRLGRFAKLWANLGGSALLLGASLGRHRDSRRRLPVYARLLAWHLRLCPDGGGLRSRRPPPPRVV
ncbi:MAG: glycosyltransferase family 2 protein, partial [Planctomycetes bacterium]|nr:glycosyltransferase family 2 protein [Planctomycetota bacterium]